MTFVVLLWICIHTEQAKPRLTMAGIEPTNFGIFALSTKIQFPNITYPNRANCVDKLADHWTGIPKVVGSIDTVARHIF